MSKKAICEMSRIVERSYENAIGILNSRRRDTRPTVASEAGTGALLPFVSDLKGKPSISGMKLWLEKLGHTENDIDGLNVIHVAGTKGKGSTCAFVNDFLAAHGQRTGFPQRVGLYTSPHLKHVRERIQINSRPLSKTKFARYTFEVWDSLKDLGADRPRYLQMLMLISVHTFLAENIDVAIYEAHSGGQFDATNIFRQPIATGISTVGLDHIEQLGPTIEHIANHKAGIFKTGIPAFSVLQDPLVAATLGDRAAKIGTELQFVDINPHLPCDVPSLSPHVQRINASLALALTNATLKRKERSDNGAMSPEDIHAGALRFSWLGRFHRIFQEPHAWFLDGAHNEMSIKIAADWFADSVKHDQSFVRPLRCVLIFSHISERDGAKLLKILANTLLLRKINIQPVIITTYEERIDGVDDIDRCFRQPKPVSMNGMKENLIKSWHSVFPDIPAFFEPTIEQAINVARTYCEPDGGQILITGSLHLVGGALRVLEPETAA